LDTWSDRLSAALALLGVTPASARVAVLVTNVLVASVTWGRFRLAGYFDWRVLMTFAAISVPCAMLGATLHISVQTYKLVLGSVSDHREHHPCAARPLADGRSALLKPLVTARGPLAAEHLGQHADHGFHQLCARLAGTQGEGFAEERRADHGADAGIQTAKRCAELIKLCHPLPLDQIVAEFQIQPDRVEVSCTVESMPGRVLTWKR